MFFTEMEVLFLVEAFERNRKRTEDLASDPNAKPQDAYPGYRAEGLLTNRAVIKCPKQMITQPEKKHFLPWVIIPRIVWMVVHGDSFLRMRL